jgi:hypothetical protein
LKNKESYVLDSYGWIQRPLLYAMARVGEIENSKLVRRLGIKKHFLIFQSFGRQIWLEVDD